MGLSSSVKAALAITALVFAYFAVSTLFRAASNGETADAAPEESPFTVSVRTIAPENWRDEVFLRGRTEALRKVTVRSETAGVVAETPVEPGRLVAEGDILCRLRIDAREAALREAEAALAKARLDYDAGVKLSKDGFRSETSVASLKAALDLAKASVEQARVEIGKTRISAPFAGVFDDRAVEVGDFLKIGDPCGVVMERSPILVVGFASERDVGKLSVGDRGLARLSTGETIDGAVRFIASSADPATRTFRIELEIPNEDGAIKDGVTADFTIFAADRDAYLVPRSALILDDEGRLGVRSVKDGVVHLNAVRLLGEAAGGVWVGGLDGRLELIVRGQEFVAEGQTVDVARSEADDRRGTAL